MSLLTLSRLRRRRGNTVPETFATSRSHRRRRRGWVNVLFVVIALLLVVRFIGSPIAKSIVNGKLGELPSFVGRVDGVTLAIWRGAIDVENFVLYERGFEDEVPVVHIRHASLRVAPSALISGKLGGSAVVNGAEITIVKRHDIPEEEKDPEEIDAELEEKKRQVQRWQDVFRETVPMELTKLEISNTRVHYVDRSTEPNADIGVENLHVVATDLQNRPKANGDPLPAKVRISAITTGNGKLESEIAVNPIAEQPTFNASFGLSGVDLTAANNFLRGYVNADVSRGTFEVFTEIEAKNGSYNGYVKPMFHDLDFRTANDDEKNLAERVKEKVVSAVASVLENEDNEQVATRAPFSGTFAQNDVDIWSTIGTLFRNAFVQALRGGFEGQPPGT